MKRLTGKTALVTGGSRGIGRAIAERLAAEGAIVAVNYATRADAAIRTVEAIEAAGGTAFAVGGDVGRHDAMEAMFAQIDARLSELTGSTALDLVINNAGITNAQPISQIDEKDLDALFDTNVKGVVFVTQAAIGRMRDGGRIVILGSGAAKQPSPRNGAYGASKAAAQAMVVALACELGSRGITVNGVVPGWTQTDITAGLLEDPVRRSNVVGATVLGRLGQPQDIAATVAFLCSPDGGWITGQCIESTGGYKLMPPA